MSQDRDIRLYMFLRLVLLFSVLISTVIYQRSDVISADATVKTYFVTFFTFLVTTGFIFLAEKARHVRYFLTSQIAYDILFTTVLIYYAGSSDTMYTVFYFFNIMFAAILFQTTGALLSALLSGALYVCIAWLNSESLSEQRFYSILTTVTAFVSIALLAGQLIEELGKSRQRISRLERLSEEIVESLDSGLLGVDANDIIRKVNRTAQEFLALPGAEAAIGRPLEEVVPALGQTSGSQMREIAVRGKLRRVLVTRIELPESHSMILVRDLSEVLELEEKVRRQERLAGVGRLAAGVAHEIRNPIASISGAAQLLNAGSADGDEKVKLAQLIQRESERVDRLVAQLLRFAKPSTPERGTIELREVVRECVESLKTRPDFQTDSMSVEVELPEPLPVRGNRDELSEVINNLLLNAIQALAEDRSKPRKLLRVEGRRGRNEVELVVSDNGPGIPREFMGRIFDPFFTTKPTGTGLGLAQVHKIIHDHSGHVDVETEQGKGTALKIRLPA